MDKATFELNQHIKRTIKEAQDGPAHLPRGGRRRRYPKVRMVTRGRYIEGRTEDGEPIWANHEVPWGATKRDPRRLKSERRAANKRASASRTRNTR